MKRFIFTVFIFSLLSSTSFAQQNNIKFTPGKLILGGVSLTYERVINPNMTVSLGTNIKLPRDLSKGEGLTDFSTENSTVEFGHLRGFTLTPEFRYYTGQQKEAPHGFYLAPFLRYLNYSVDPSLVYTHPETGAMSNINSKIRMTGIGGGFSVGHQWVISDAITIDWYFGLGIAPSTIKFNGEVDGQLQEDLQAFVDEVNVELDDIPFYNFSIDPAGTSIDGKIGVVPWVIVRGGLSIGYYF